ncbi:enoyl-CoA hydratase/isomerase family protein [Piscibacillus salipiscarius]|uniref:enoyl-CoA hydratase/isomerase family protein n=1 Tax=Piscibacillus salipiscarius TaxID=299480 RepID=UPI0006D1FB97|nr:enoyl-CoA hydratase/isomerase family protein [Piscibacillus salipiscarius]
MAESSLYIDPKQYAVITLNRPHKLNSISKNTIKELDNHLTEVTNRHDLKFLIITGNGEKAFCSGGDLNDFHGEMSEQEAYKTLKPMQEIIYKLATLHIPTIAWLNGLARGGGLELASACDFRFATPNADFGFIQGKLGIATGWGGGTLLYERINSNHAFQWMIESDIKTTSELLTIGFFQKEINDLTISENHEALKPYIDRSVEQMRHWKKQRLNFMELNLMKKEWKMK